VICVYHAIENEHALRQKNLHLVQRMAMINSRTGISEEFGGNKIFYPKRK